VLSSSGTDVTLPLREVQAFINVVAGSLRRTLGPGALLAASLKLRLNRRWNERNGRPGIGQYYEDDVLVAAGGDALGTLDLRQYQFYPEATRGGGAGGWGRGVVRGYAWAARGLFGLKS
jgi:hypothetical protein